MGPWSGAQLCEMRPCWPPLFLLPGARPRLLANHFFRVGKCFFCRYSLFVCFKVLDVGSKASYYAKQSLHQWRFIPLHPHSPSPVWLSCLQDIMSFCLEQLHFSTFSESVSPCSPLLDTLDSRCLSHVKSRVL